MDKGEEEEEEGTGSHFLKVGEEITKMDSCSHSLSKVEGEEEGTEVILKEDTLEVKEEGEEEGDEETEVGQGRHIREEEEGEEGDKETEVRQEEEGVANPWCTGSISVKS